MLGRNITIMYGSQTGQAEAIAEIIHETSSEHGIKSTLVCLKESDRALKILDEGRYPVVFICSTTGDGELPENARKFMRSLRNKQIDFLISLDYALLGLGDTNYSTFCGGPKTLESRLKKFGAKSFYDTGYADDGTDLALVVEPWIEGLWPALDRHFSTKPDSKNGENGVSDDIMNVDEIPKNDITVELQKLNLSSSQHQQQSSEYSLQMSDTSNLLFHKELSAEINTKFSLPSPMQSYLTILPVDDTKELLLSSRPHIPYPIAEDDRFYFASVQLAVKLTKENSVKDTLCFALQVPNEFSYEPGDSFGVCVSNPKREVDWLLERLKLTRVANQPIRFKVCPDCTKKNARVPKYIPEVCTRKYVLANLLEIRSVPKRTFLRVLLDHTTDEIDRTILTRLSCREGMQEFQKYVRIPHLNILDILASLPSCLPPFEVLVEHLPRLQPRLYSAASSLTTSPGLLRFAFNVVNFVASEGRMYGRKGLATGTLEQMYTSLQPYSPLRNKLLSKLSEVPATNNLTIFKTKNTHFRLPPRPETPVIMVGPGAGVAPFIGFLEQLRYHKFTHNISPITWLFYGCRHEQRDFLFREELKSFVESGTLSHLVVSFSQDEVPNCDVTNSLSRPKYVQDNIRLHAKEIADLLLRQNAILYVCGDAKNMSADVKVAIVDILQGNGMSSRDEALTTVKLLVKEGRYKEDVW